MEYPKFVHGNREWTLYSLDLKLCNFFLWRYLKDKCYAIQPQEFLSKELIHTSSIRKFPRSISIVMLDDVFQGFQKRLQFYADSDGKHLENIYY